MELENIVANTVYLKAREGKYLNLGYLDRFRLLAVDLQSQFVVVRKSLYFLYRVGHKLRTKELCEV